MKKTKDHFKSNARVKSMAKITKLFIPIVILVITGLAVFALRSSSLKAQDADITVAVPLPDITSILQQIATYENELGDFSADNRAKLEQGADFVSFTSEMKTENESSETIEAVTKYPDACHSENLGADEILPADVSGPQDDNYLAPISPSPIPGFPGIDSTASPHIRTLFNTKADTVEKRTKIKQGNEVFSFTATLDNQGAPYQQTTISGDQGGRQVYYRPSDVFIYSQGATANGDIRLKEWIYAKSPNLNPVRDNHQLKSVDFSIGVNETGSRYVWNFQSDSDNYSLILRQKDDGCIELYRQMRISGLDDKDSEKRQSVMAAVRKVFNSKANINDEQLIASFEPLIYWTKDNIRKTGKFSLIDDHTLAMTIEEPLSAYPLVIDPSLIYGQWLGGAMGTLYINSLAVEIDEIYAGGYAEGPGIDETVTFHGAYSGGYEGFVVEIADGAAPTLNWGQWLGGTGTDYVYALAVTGDEIYAGGSSTSATSWETVTFQGVYSGSTEGFVVEIADGAAPTLNWGQWLGGTGTDYVYALAVTGDEIYAGGSSTIATSWETVTFQGDLSGAEGFVVEIADGAAPTLNWGQWLGGTGTDYVYALAVTGDEIYAGGSSSIATSWETVTFQGDLSGTEGFVVEIADGAAPTLNWGQWLGGTGTDYVYALAVTGDEIYAGGSSTNATSWETVTFQGAISGTEGFVVEIADGAAPTLNWGQWLGGTGTDYVYALAVTGDEIYAGGSSTSATSWETVTFQGDLSGTEGFVVEIADGAAPTLNWGQWLGGTGTDYVYALAVTGDEIYAGGYSTSATFWETVTFQGDLSGTEGFVVEIADGASGAPAANAIFFWDKFLEKAKLALCSCHIGEENMRIRKHIRLKDYDYKSDGYYFVTICCSNKNTVAVERSEKYCSYVAAERSSAKCNHDGKAGALQLPKYSAIIEKYLANLEKYEGVKVDYYKLMTDHLHFILVLEEAKLSLCSYIQDFKSKTTLEIKKDGFAGKRFWQPNYYEHIIRNEISLSKIRQYIEDNPLAENLNWAELDR